MMPRLHTRAAPVSPRRLLPAIPAVAAVAMLLLAIFAPADPLRAQDQDRDDDLAEGALQAPLVDVSTGRRAHGLVERWVRAGTVPSADDDALSELPVTGVFGVHVTLRLDGLTIAEGSAYRPDSEDLVDAPGPALDLVTLLRPATRQALEAARDRLAQAHFRATMGQIQGAETPATPRLEGIAGQLLVDVQLGHQLERIQIPPRAEREAVFAHFAPGFHGLRSPGEDEPGQAIVWPASALARNMAPRAQCMQLLDARGLDPEAIVRLGRPDGLELQRFQVIHLVRPQPHMPPLHLVRGSILLPPHSIDGADLDGMVERLANHLGGRFTSDHIVRGTYHPTGNHYDPQIASARSAALACYALMRHARRRGALVGADEAQVADHADTARHGAVAISGMLLDQSEPANPGTTALVLLTFVDDLEQGEEAELRDRLTDHLLAVHDEEQGTFLTRNSDGESEPATAATRAVATAALAAVYRQTRDDRLAPIVREQMQRLGDAHEGGPDVAALPWLALAHRRAGHLLMDADALAQRRRAMGELIDRLIGQQVIERPVLGPADVVGGFELQRAPAGAPPSPDWRTAQLLSFLAIALRDDGIVEARRVPERALSAGLAGRFIAQLMMDEASSFYVRSLDETIGGVRLSPWDNRLAVAPTAMSLLACVQLQETLDHLSANAGE